MKINSKILSLPPYVSTSWRDVQSVHQNDGVLVISLLNGENVVIPGLSESLIASIFSAHEAYLEEEALEDAMSPVKLFSTGNLAMDNVGNMLQHNPEQADAPDLPSEMLHKIADVAKLIIPEDPAQLPVSEPHCNCMYCQIARVINETVMAQTDTEIEVKGSEPTVEAAELTFQQWDIAPAGEELYNVTSRLDPQESYRVFLGNPIGCTCGVADCEHLIAVLKS